MIVGLPDWSTWCLIDGEAHQLEHAPGGGPQVGGAPVDEQRIESVFVDHADPPGPRCRAFPLPAGYGPPTRPALRVDAETALVAALRRHAPEGWHSASVTCAALGTRIAVSATVVVEGEQRWWIAPFEVVQWLRRHRVLTYTPRGGAWTNFHIDLHNGSDLALSADHEPPRWPRGSEDEREYFDELRYLPRVEAPDWLLEPAVRFHKRHWEDPPAPPGPVTMAALFDERDAEQRPQVFRPVLSASEKVMLAEYFGNAHTVLSAPGTSADEVDPERSPDVPKEFCTDGEWVWPLSMVYYLHHHDITPPAGFLDHIRRRGYRVPDVVAVRAMESAKALVLGTDADALDGGHVAKSVDVVRRTVASLGISRRFYGFEGGLEGGWNMVRDPDGWWSVHYLFDGVRRNESRFPFVIEAGAHLVGSLTMTRDDFLRAPDEPLADYECPYQPSELDLPLAGYDRRLLVNLPAGAEVDRFGPDQGNTVFVAGTTLPQRAMPGNAPPGEYRRYRVLTGFEVVTGVARPAHGQVGGGTAYFLPQPVAELVSGGWLAPL